MVAAAGVWLNQISIFLLLLPLYIVADRAVCGRLGLDGGQPARFPAGHGAVRQRAADVLVLGDPDLRRRPATYPHWGRFLFAANPLHYLVRGYRIVLLGTGMPDLRDLGIGVGLRRGRIPGRRPVFPAHEARFRRRSIAAAGCGPADRGAACSRPAKSAITGSELLRMASAVPASPAGSRAVRPIRALTGRNHSAGRLFRRGLFSKKASMARRTRSRLAPAGARPSSCEYADAFSRN